MSSFTAMLDNDLQLSVIIYVVRRFIPCVYEDLADSEFHDEMIDEQPWCVLIKSWKKIQMVKFVNAISSLQELISFACIQVCIQP